MSNDIENITKEVGQLKKGKLGRPKGAKNIPRPIYKKNKYINENGKVAIPEIVGDSELSRDDKLRVLTAIAKDPNSGTADIIKAMQAHSELIGEALNGMQKLIIRVEIINPKHIGLNWSNIIIPDNELTTLEPIKRVEDVKT
jgi:hypothetical protein